MVGMSRRSRVFIAASAPTVPARMPASIVRCGVLAFILWPADRIPPQLKIGEGTRDGRRKFLAIDIAVHGDGAPVAVLNSLTDRAEDVNPTGVDLRAFREQRCLGHRKCNGRPARIVLDGQSCHLRGDDAVLVAEGAGLGSFQEDVVVGSVTRGGLDAVESLANKEVVEPQVVLGGAGLASDDLRGVRLEILGRRPVSGL